MDTYQETVIIMASLPPRHMLMALDVDQVIAALRQEYGITPGEPFGGPEQTSPRPSGGRTP